MISNSLGLRTARFAFSCLAAVALTACSDDIASTESGRTASDVPEVRDGVGRENTLHNEESIREQLLERDADRRNELQASFVVLDKNDSGSLEPEEWIDGMSNTFTSADLNNDGQVSREELLDSQNDEVVSK